MPLHIKCTSENLNTQHITMQRVDTDRLRFLLLLLYCSEKTLLLLLFGWLWRTQIQRLGSRPDKKHTTRTRYSVYCKTNLPATIACQNNRLFISVHNQRNYNNQPIKMHTYSYIVWCYRKIIRTPVIGNDSTLLTIQIREFSSAGV